MKKSADKNLLGTYKSLKDLKSDFRNINLLNLVIKRLKKGTLVDIGSGAGHLLNVAEKRGFKAYGIEPSKNLIKLCEQLYNGNSHKIINQGVEGIGKINEKISNVTMIDVLEHIEDDYSALQSICNAIDMNGKLVIVVPAYQSLYGKRDKKIGHFRRYNSKSLKSILENTGFDVIECRYWNMAGVAPYFIYEKILKREISTSTRSYSENSLKKILNKVMFFWFKNVENNISLGFGLSVLCVARPNKSQFTGSTGKNRPKQGKE